MMFLHSKVKNIHMRMKQKQKKAECSILLIKLKKSHIKNTELERNERSNPELI